MSPGKRDPADGRRGASGSLLNRPPTNCPRALTQVAGSRAKAGIFAPTWLRGADIEFRLAIGESILAEAQRLMEVKGLRAFEQPRSSACAHEAAHAVIGAAYGDTIRRVEISRRKDLERLYGFRVWTGFTFGGRPWSVSPDTSVDELRARIARIAAGIIGEAVLDPGGCRPGSSLDEVVVAQAFAAELHRRVGRDGHPASTWREIWDATADILRRNEAVARALMDKLDRFGSCQGTPLAAILAEVQP
jgi:hypothetical protein